MVHVKRAQFQGNPNIGMYAVASDTVALAGVGIDVKDIEHVLKVPVHTCTIAGTSLVGVFCYLSKNTLFVPHIVFESELQKLRKHFTVIVVATKLTALGNNMIYHNGLLIVHEEFEDTAIAQIAEQITVRTVKKMSIADTDVIGASVVLAHKGGLVHMEVSQEEKLELEELLDISLTKATVCYGSPYVRSGVIANTNGFLIGQTSNGPEITNADEGFGFIAKN